MNIDDLIKKYESKLKYYDNMLLNNQNNILFSRYAVITQQIKNFLIDLKQIKREVI